jgi:hypothetical protein
MTPLSAKLVDFVKAVQRLSSGVGYQSRLENFRAVKKMFKMKSSKKYFFTVQQIQNEKHKISNVILFTKNLCQLVYLELFIVGGKNFLLNGQIFIILFFVEEWFF